jgi:hypothetical protein
MDGYRQTQIKDKLLQGISHYALICLNCLKVFEQAKIQRFNPLITRASYPGGLPSAVPAFAKFCSQTGNHAKKLAEPIQ